MRYTLITLIASTTSVIARGPYCGRGPSPDVSHCQAAIAKINNGSEYSSGTSIDADDCSIKVDIILGGVEGLSITGQQMIDVASSVLTQCGGIGWGFDDPQGGFRKNISVEQCQVCMYGVCSVCTAPESKKMRRDLSEAIAEQNDAPTAVQEHKRAMVFGEEDADKLLGRSPLLTKRQDAGCANPIDWTYCCSSIAAAEANDCKALADSLRGKTLELPFIGVEEDCELAIESYKPGNTVSGDTIADKIKKNVDACQSGGYIGSIHDYSVGPDQPGAYDMYLGELCGEFGIGVASCAIGDSPE